MIVYVVVDKITGGVVDVYDYAQGAINAIVGKDDCLEVVDKEVLTKPDTKIKSIIEVNEKVYDPLHFNSTLKFGKYKGQTIGDVMQNAPDYLEWCINNINLKLDEYCLDLLTVAMEKFNNEHHKK